MQLSSIKQADVLVIVHSLPDTLNSVSFKLAVTILDTRGHGIIRYAIPRSGVYDPAQFFKMYLHFNPEKTSS